MGLETEVKGMEGKVEKFDYRLEVCSVNSAEEKEKWIESISRYYDKIGRLPDATERRTEIVRFLEKGNVVVILLGEEIVALVNVYCNNYETLEGYMNNGEVVVEHRRRGLMRRIMQKTVDICMEKGFKSASLHVAEGNVGAETIFLQLGFKRTGKSKETVDGLLHEMKLTL